LLSKRLLQNACRKMPAAKPQDYTGWEAATPSRGEQRTEFRTRKIKTGMAFAAIPAELISTGCVVD
jgi:hypothetical protein